METRFFEIRDRGTFIPAMAIRVIGENGCNAIDRYLMRSAGLDHKDSYQIFLIDLQKGIGFFDEYAWGCARTLKHAHNYITQNFEKLISGAVIDVEFILGETTEPKKSQIHDDLKIMFNDPDPEC